MSGWDSYRAVHGAELRAAAWELAAHGWPVVERSDSAFLLVTGNALDVLEVPAAIGRGVCARLRAAGVVAPVAATPTGAWWYPIAAGAELAPDLAAAAGVVLHGEGGSVLAPPSQVPDGWVHWRVAPALTGHRLPAAELVIRAASDAVRWHELTPAGVTDRNVAAYRDPAPPVPVGPRS